MKNLILIIFMILSILFANKAYALSKTYEVNVNHVWANHLDDSTRARSALIATYGVFTNKSGNYIVATFSDGTRQIFFIKDTTTAGVIPAGDAEQPSCENQHIDSVVDDYSEYKVNDLTLSINNLSSFKKNFEPMQTNCRGEDEGSPLLIDLGNDGFELSMLGIGVKFDLFDRGMDTHFQWVREGTNDAFLALDLNENSIIDNGAELFGEGTTLLKNDLKAKNGFQALKQYDERFLGGNHDGKISSDDDIWYKLILWIDSNSDGVSNESEIIRLSESDIKSLSLKFHKRRIVINGNRIPFWSVAWGRTQDYSLVDVYFRQLF